MNDEEIYTEDKSESFEINYTNNKGFFLYITKNLELISEFRLRNENEQWFKTLDSLYLATFPFWKNPTKIEEYKKLYLETSTAFNNAAKARTITIGNGYNSKILSLLRRINELVSENTAHLMIRISNTDSEDESFWQEVMNENSKV